MNLRGGSSPMGGIRMIGTADGVGVAAQLAADRRRGASQLGSERPDRHPGPMQIGDVQPLVFAEEPWRNHRWPSSYRSIRVAPAIDSYMSSIAPAPPGPDIDPYLATRLGVGQNFGLIS